jgi:hypothetical protein
MAIAAVKITVAGQEYNAAYNSTSGKWEATLTAPSVTSYNLEGGYYPVSVSATNTAGTMATVDATDPTLGESLRLTVKETVKPTIAVVTPGAGAHLPSSTPSITFQLRDETNGSGVNLPTLAFSLDAAQYTAASPGVTATPVTGGYNVTFVPQTAIADGQHSLTVNVSDNDGNAANAATRTFYTDTVPPELDISSPNDGLITNTPSLTVSGVTNSEGESSVTVAITLNDVDQGAVTVQSNGTFSLGVTLTEGENEIVVTVTDAAGQQSTASATVTLDTTEPVFTSVSVSPNPANTGATVIISVEVA